MTTLNNFFIELANSIQRNDFVKITLSKPLSKKNELQNVYIRQIQLKDEMHFSFTYRYQTKDQVKNYLIEEAKVIIEELLFNAFRFGTLFTLKEDVQCFISKKKKVSLKKNHASFKNKLPENHDLKKERKVIKSDYLFHLGISDRNDQIIPKMADKYRQINKYLEIIDGLIENTTFPKTIQIVDMGSGKGYLTFALYDYLKNNKQLDINVVGIELRKELVDYCNDIARKCKFEQLSFICNPIEAYQPKTIDILIALHACDTATDDALYKGIASDAKLIITAPCCHKQIRKQLKGSSPENPILKYGIFKERQYEMLTDTLRALILEKERYSTKIFEFISNEHTRKNVMLIGKKSIKSIDLTSINSKINKLKQEFGVTEHYLEKLMNNN